MTLVGVLKKKGMDRITEMGTQIGEAFKTCVIYDILSHKEILVLSNIIISQMRYNAEVATVAVSYLMAL